jgi:hypothetical protein
MPEPIDENDPEDFVVVKVKNASKGAPWEYSDELLEEHLMRCADAFNGTMVAAHAMGGLVAANVDEAFFERIVTEIYEVAHRSPYHELTVRSLDNVIRTRLERLKKPSVGSN